jgi:hypothetical protein
VIWATMVAMVVLYPEFGTFLRALVTLQILIILSYPVMVTEVHAL